MPKKLNTELFVSRSKSLYKDRYDYSKVKYINNRNKIMIICKVHGIFSVWPSAFLQGHSCSKCAHVKILNSDDFINRAKSIHETKYDYSITEYEDYNKKIKIICKHHGIFEQKPSIHLRGHGCPLCGIISSNIVKRKKEFKANLKYNKDNIYEKFYKVHNNIYEYNKETFKSMNNKLEIYCFKHGSFYQTGFNHIRGHGCPVCKESSGELTINEILTKKGINFFRQYRFKECKNELPLPFDFYLPELKICIEYDGKQHFEESSIYYSPKIIINDEIKTLYCKNNGIRIVRIPYWDLKNIPEIINKEVF